MDFRRRPLTWLFFIATACLDALALATNNESDFADALVLGQLFIASGWLVLGRSHRLARAAVFVTAIGLLMAPDFVIPRLKSRFYMDLVWPHVLGMLIAMGLATAAVTLGWLVMAQLTSHRSVAFRRADWQFPVVELFGWTIVVAVASAGLRLADFSLIRDPRDVSIALALVALAAAIMTLALGDYGPGPGWRTVAAAGLIGWMAILLAATLPVDAHVAAVGALGYTACWAIAMRLDNRSPIL